MKVMKKYLAFLLLFGVLACSESIEIDPDTGFEIFVMEAGSHSSIVRTEEFDGNGIQFKVIFDQSAVYTTQSPGNQGDINKLLGFSYCLKHHRTESARFGWRWFEDELQLLTYVYTDGDRTFEPMGSVPFDQAINLRIDILPEAYRFSGDGLTTIEMPRNSEDCEAGTNYWLWPYFGGDETPSHDIRVLIERETL